MGKNKIKNKPKILFILQIPHPCHGASILGAIIKNSLLINEEFECEFLRNFTTPLKNNSNNIFLKLICIKVYLRLTYTKQFIVLEKSSSFFKLEHIFLNINRIILNCYKAFLACIEF